MARHSMTLAYIVVAFMLAGTAGFFALRMYHRVQRMLWISNACAWATFAGTAEADNQYHAGFRRYYRLGDPAHPDQTSKFTGEHRNGMEVWTWPAPDHSLDGWSESSQAFVDAYNRRMQFILKEAATQPSER